MLKSSMPALSGMSTIARYGNDIHRLQTMATWKTGAGILA
jgi:hypothetical protein